MVSMGSFWRRQKKKEPKKEREGAGKANWKSWARTAGGIVIALGVVLGSIYAYTGVWPPLLIAESSSMQHGDTTSHIGTIDTGDLVLVQAASTRADVITYIQGRSIGYSTYGDSGDVIVFRLAQNPSATPIIHRAVMYLIPNGTGADVPDLADLPTTEWQGYRDGVRVSGTGDLTTVTVHHMGYDHDLDITFDLSYFVQSFPGHAGYITMGDNNAYHDCSRQPIPCTTPYDTSWFPAQGDIIGHARGEIPWFGLVKLVLLPTATCAHGWADPCAPLNSWDDLALGFAVIFTFPFIIEGAAWVWSTCAWPLIGPRLPRIWGKTHGAPPKEGVLQTEPDADHPGKRSSGP